jgi:peptidyl-prolyl cis-trans isomerase C
MDLHEYENALKTFYKAEILDGQADFMSDMNQKIVSALENLGMTQQAQYELDARTDISGKTAPSEAKAVARIGKDEILETEINRAIDKMPEWMKKNFESPELKLKFIREYVAAEVLYRKAKRLGLDKTPDTKDAVESFKKQVVVEQIVKKEIDKNLKISQEDVELYYKANKDKYIEPEGIKVSYAELKDESKKVEAVNQLKEGNGTKIEDWIKKDDTYISGIGEAKDVIAGLFLKEKGEFTDPLKVNEKFYIFSIIDKRQKREKDFNEVKSQAEYEYKSKKQNEIMNSLLKKALEEQDVGILYEPRGE